MEQKRIVWILSAAGVFLCIVIGSAFLVYGHGAAASKNATAISLRDSGSVWVSSAGTSTQPVQYAGAGTSQNAAEQYENSLAAGISVPEEGQTMLFSPTEENAVSQGSSIPPSESSPYLTITQDASGESAQGAVSQSSQVVEGVAPTGASVTFIATTNVYQVPDKSQQSSVTFDLSSSYSGNGSESSVVAQNKAAEDAMKVTEAAKKQRTYGAQESAGAKSKAQSSTSSAKTSSQKTEVAQEKPKATLKESVSTTVTTNTSTKKTNVTSSAKSALSQANVSIPDRFWVQAASYSTKKKADEARTVLDENQIQCEVFTYEDDKGSLFYRVRVGPYSTRDEASYWKDKIDSLELFAKAGTYIVNSSAPIAKK